MKPLLVSSGEPAGIGPDICLALAGCPLPLVVLGDKGVLAERAQQLDLPVIFDDYQEGVPVNPALGRLTVLSCSARAPVTSGQLLAANGAYVLEMLSVGVERCRVGEFSALVTAPVHKAVINNAGYNFTGHTEFLAAQCDVETVVMMLVSGDLRIALLTTHLPLKEVSAAVTKPLMEAVIGTLHQSLVKDFGLSSPIIHVAGLNPHAGESGHLGHEEIQVINPVLEMFQRKGLKISGPFAADTMFCAAQTKQCDAFLAMYHDQGLPVLKYAGFGQAVNVTLGLPIIRTSVDHGTALELAGTGRADPSSLLAAVELAANMSEKRGQLSND